MVAEQLGMLLGAGYSLGSALSRLAERGQGACGAGPPPGAGRVRQGLGEVDALREWADLADVDALRRLVAVLASTASRATWPGSSPRRPGPCGATSTASWSRPSSGAPSRSGSPSRSPTLVPGVIFLAVPFVEALRLFANS